MNDQPNAEEFYERVIRRRTEHFNNELLVLLKSQEDSCGELRESLEYDIDEVKRTYFAQYQQDKALYHLDLNLKFCKNCRFFYPNPGEDLVHPSKCRLKQFEDVVSIKIDALELSNQTKPYIFHLIYGKPILIKKNMTRRFKRLQTWSSDRVNLIALFDQLVEEIALLNHSELSEFFESFLSELAPGIQARFSNYEALGWRECLRCNRGGCKTSYDLDSYFLKWPDFQNSEDIERLFSCLFRQIFYGSLLDFIQIVKSN